MCCVLQVSNKLHGWRFKVQESSRKVQECMNGLEKEHAWQDHTAHLTTLLHCHLTALQVTCTCHTSEVLACCSADSRHECAPCASLLGRACLTDVALLDMTKLCAYGKTQLWTFQDTQGWLEMGDASSTQVDAASRPMTPGNQDATPWGEAKADASWDTQQQQQLEDIEKYPEDEFLDIAAPDDFQVVGRKKKKTGRQGLPGGVRGRRGH